MGSVNLDNTGSGSAITLSSDGTSLLLNGTAIGGGGGADLYAVETTSSTNPTASGTRSIAIGSGANANGTSSIAIGSLADCSTTESYQIAIGHNATATYGHIAIGYNTTSTAVWATAVGYDASAGYQGSAFGVQAESTSNFATALGHSSRAAGLYSTALPYSRTSGTHSFAAAITNKSSSYGASGSYSMAGGYLNKATATDTLCWGGDSNLVTSGQAAVVGGWMNQAEGGYSFIGGGRNNRALASYSRAGGHDADTNDDHGKDVWASGDFSSRGDAQTAKRVLRSDTTDATAEALTSINGSPNTTNQVVLPNNSAYFFTGTCIARQQAADGTDVGAWEFKGAIRREANAGTTTLIKSTIDEFNVPTGWALALSADTTNGCLKIEVTGAASTDIRWVATVHTSEVTYA